MTKPSTETGSISMIGATGNTGQATYYVLYNNGHLWAVGDNTYRQLGQFNTTYYAGWRQPLYSNVSTDVMNDIEWISPQEHDNTYYFINVIKSGTGELWNWGHESGSHLGRGVQSSFTQGTPVNPGAPSNFTTGSNANIIKVESGGHTTMILRKCEKNFGYVGHRIHGSMGNGSDEEKPEDSFSFTTAPMQIAGAITTATIRNDVSQTFCAGSTITLVGQPANGTFAIATGGTGTPTLNGTQITFTGAGTVKVKYTGIDACTPDTAVFNVGNCKSVTGSIWKDDNGNAVKDGTEANTNNGGSVWVNLVDPSGNVVQSVQVDNYGNYVLSATNPVTGDYKIIVTNSKKTEGSSLSAADAPANSYNFTGTNIDGTAEPGNRTGIITLTDFQNRTDAPVNIGMTDQPLSVNFGSISAKIINGNLVIDFATLKESNNSRFEIEASKDGISFTKIGELTSQAKDGNSSSVINYTFSKDLGSATAILGFSLLALGGLGLGFKRNRKFLFGLALIAGMSFLYVGCKKADQNLSSTEGNLYVRVVQVDKDGAKTYSKVERVKK